MTTATDRLAEIEGRLDQSGFYLGKTDSRGMAKALRAVLAITHDALEGTPGSIRSFFAADIEAAITAALSCEAGK